MSIRIDWGTGNTDADSVKIYRATSPIDLANLPSALVTLPGSETSYIDATAARNKVYHYVIAITKGNDVVLSQNKAYGYFPDTGPGPTTLIRGDWTEGYFGTLTAAEFYTAAELVSATGINATANTSLNIWCKFALDGKVVFIPMQSVCTDASLSKVYLAGCVFGSDDNGNHPWKPNAIPGATATIQNKKVTKAGFTYAVRLPKGSTAPTNEYAASTMGETHMNSEWFRTMGRVFLNSSLLTTRPRCDDYLYIGGNSYNAHGYTLTQHYYNNAGYIVMFGNTAFDALATGNGYSTAGYYWRPILELVL